VGRPKTPEQWWEPWSPRSTASCLSTAKSSWGCWALLPPGFHQEASCCTTATVLCCKRRSVSLKSLRLWRSSLPCLCLLGEWSSHKTVRHEMFIRNILPIITTWEGHTFGSVQGNYFKGFCMVLCPVSGSTKA